VARNFAQFFFQSVQFFKICAAVFCSSDVRPSSTSFSYLLVLPIKILRSLNQFDFYLAGFCMAHTFCVGDMLCDSLYRLTSPSRKLNVFVVHSIGEYVRC